MSFRGVRDEEAKAFFHDRERVAEFNLQSFDLEKG